MRIPRFRPAEFPQVCESAWRSLKARHVQPTRGARADGTDEVAGITPDLPLRAEPGESLRSLAARTLKAIAGDLASRR